MAVACQDWALRQTKTIATVATAALADAIRADSAEQVDPSVPAMAQSACPLRPAATWAEQEQPEAACSSRTSSAPPEEAAIAQSTAEK